MGSLAAMGIAAKAAGRPAEEVMTEISILKYMIQLRAKVSTQLGQLRARRDQMQDRLKILRDKAMEIQSEEQATTKALETI
eukprot:6250637-Pyramimonas_sp.AAC.1